jgi:hypothetical protein
MAVRYVPKHKSGVFLVDKSGRKRFFQGQRRLPDGTLGYKPDEIKGLSRDAMRAFRIVEVSGSEIEEDVEQATQAPGEKRARRPKKETTEDDK